MSSTLNRKLSSASIEGRRNSEDGLLSAGGTLRRAAAIPVMEEDNALSPLKQLQRLNQNGSFRVVAKNRPSLPVPSHVRTNSCDKSSTSSSSPSSSCLSLESSGKRSDITDSCINNNVDKSSTTQSTENVCSPNHNDHRCLTLDDSTKHSTNKLSRSDTNGNITSPVSEKDSTDRTVSSCDSNLGPVTPYARASEDMGQTVDSQKCKFDGEGSSDKNEPRVNDKSPPYDRTEKSFCPLALDLHPHQSHIVDFTRTYGVPGPKQSPPPPPVTTQRVTVEVHRTDSPDSPSDSLRNGDMGVQPPANDCGQNTSMKKELPPATSPASESNTVLPKEQNAMSNNQVTSPDPKDEQKFISNKGLSPVSEGPVIVIHGESDYDVPRSQITRVNDPKSPTAVTPTRKVRLSRPKCKAPPPPTSPRTASIRDSLCSSSSTHSVNSSASSSQSESVTSQSSGISSSGSALSQCSQSTLTSDGEGSRPKVIDGHPRTPTHGYTRPKGPAPPPPANRKPARPPPIVFHERAVSEPKEALSVWSPHEGNYDIPKRIMSPHSPRPASIAPSWKCPVEGHYDVVRSPEAVSPLSRNVEVRRSTLGTTGEIKVTPIPRDNTQVSTFLAPATKPVIDVKLVKNDRKPTSPHPRNKVVSSTEEMNTINRQRMTRSAEDLDQKYVDFIELPPPRPVSPTVRNSFMGSDVEIPREAVYNSIGEMNTILKTTVPEKEKIYSLPQPQCHGDDTLKAVKAITEKYDTLERHRQRAVSFRDNSRTSVSSAAKSEPTSPMVAIQEVSASDPQLSDATDFVFPEGSQSGVPNNVDPCAPPISQRQVEDAPGSPDAIMDLSYGGIQARDISRIDLFYRGQGTEVVVCTCMASLSVGIPSATSDEIETWEGPLHTGVPVIVFNTGVGKRARELFVVLAERETGFPLWQDKVSYLTNYHPMSPLVHALSPAKNLRQKLAITFMQEQAAQEFLDKFKEITSNPNDDLWKISNPKQEKKHRRLSFRRKKNTKKDYNKTEISKPCNFTHLTNINPKDRKLMQDISSHEYDCSGSSEQQQRRMKTKTM